MYRGRFFYKNDPSTFVAGMIDLKKYKSLLIQDDTGEVVDTKSWNIYTQSIPFQIIPDIKDYATNDWADEDGEEVYIPTRPVYKAYDLTVKFVFVGDEYTDANSISDFFDFIRFGKLAIYDEYTKIGRKDVYYKSYSPTSFYRRDGENDIVEFSITFRICDPITNIELNRVE